MHSRTFASTLQSAVITLALFAPALVRADEPSVRVAQLLREPRTLQSWVDKTSLAVASSRADLAEARAHAQGARLLPNPVLDVGAQNVALGNTNPKGLGVDRTLILGVGVSETIELGKRGPRAQAADLHAAATDRARQATLGEHVQLARSALARTVYAQARAQALSEALRAAQAAADVARGRLDHQALSGADYDRLLIDLSSLQADVTRAEAEAAAALELCRATLAARCDLQGATISDVEVSATVPAEHMPALEARADVAALKLEREAAQHEAVLANRRSIPDLTFRLGYTHDRFTVSGDNQNTLGLSVALPIPIFDHGQADASAALARADAFDAQRNGALLAARGSLAELRTRARAIDSTLRAIEGDTLPRADAVLAAQEKGLAEGQLDMTDLLLARQKAVELRLTVLDLHFERFDVNNELRRTLGLDDAIAER